MDNEFRVTPMFPDEYKDFIAEICYGQEYVCTVMQERGPGLLEIGFERTSRRLPLAEFLQAVEHAKRRLDDLREVRSEE